LGWELDAKQGPRNRGDRRLPPKLLTVNAPGPLPYFKYKLYSGNSWSRGLL
jgi:hypothetical protein